MYQDLDDIIFEDRHKAYGAYEFRKHYEFTLTKALVVGLFIFSVLFFLPTSLIKPTKQTAVNSELIIPVELTEMRINYGDNRNGKGAEEPKEEEGSPAPIVEKKEEKEVVAEVAKTSKEKVEKDVPENTIPTPTRTKTTPVATKKSNEKVNAPTVANSTKNTTGKTNAKGDIKKENATGDGRGNAAIGNLLKGRGTKSGSQGNGTSPGNYGDPLGGDGDGNSLIGVDRKLVGFIPGTMGRGGAQPNHDCQASGSISISYTVDKSGKVTSAKRLSGVSDPCVTSTAVNWVKQYVKAEASSVSSKGTYKIVF
ncbi:ferric siderophore ABC transporter substrate-binding protein [Chryseobacterium sp. FH1]|uniref:ferric siderophore ABC transporter substrate-binding protein n=1 Tax=Chryseobacterium sp. FH1 TaxID=1233951 RepID=UPI000A705A95|nr:ferric siderophore ABC transporter substrate-binding protein [Chryseobacterium sp. FH1]